MGKIGILALLCLIGLSTGMAESLLDLRNPPREWNSLLENFSEKLPLKCDFVELRRNPFHKRPRRFEGKVAWIPEIGLSLRYTQPSELILNILPDGAYMKRGEVIEKIPALGDQGESLQVFTKVFEWDTDWLAENFSISKELSVDMEWVLVLRPLNEAMTSSFSKIDLKGDRNQLTRIHIQLKGNRSIEINLSNQQRPADFSEEDMDASYPMRHED